MSQPTSKDKPNYKKTLNLPKTAFAMKANLVQREPQFQKRWDKLALYSKLRERGTERERFVLHDGPPYANGSIHLGHLLNRVLKDMVVRSHEMLGFDSPFVPGWDCHGLPIEHKVVKDLGDRAREMNPAQIRKRCQDYASKFVKLQRKEMQRLGLIGDFEDPYLTMTPRFEAATLEVFAKLVERGLVYRALRPVHWSIANQTALAEAELEYQDREDDSIYTLFEVVDNSLLPTTLEADSTQPVHLMIWTTTPWTLPANQAVAVSASAEYGLFKFEKDGFSGQAIVATALKQRVFDDSGYSATLLGRCTGGMLVEAGLTYRHPFIDRQSVVVSADYVTLEDGTGLVHTAPGHGADDFQTGRKHGLAVYCPVRGDGTFDESAPDWLQDRTVWDANPIVIERLKESGNLFHHLRFMHSYPHDWRSKTPTIFRATEQWFVAVDDDNLSIRKLGLEAANGVRFIPDWGRNRLGGMLESRPDWCISRQRNWGLPIPAFFGPKRDQVLLTAASVKAISAAIAEKGSDEWFRGNAPALLADYNPGEDPDAPEWMKDGSVAREELRPSGDIFDVWFESGSSWYAVAHKRDLGVPVDLYLEGSDQHRGWFQLSLLTSLGFSERAPFRQVLTHGFMVDRQGKKMSKSGGNALAVDELMKQFGADVCRWWVCSLNSDNDIKIDLELFALAGEEYRKVRNTIRFLLSNLGDFDPAEHAVPLAEIDPESIDAWVLGEIDRVTVEVSEAFKRFEFRRVHEAIYHFCNDTLSSVYLTAIKDRLYCDASASDRRRRTQTAVYEVAERLIRLVAPVLVHTADEAFLALHGEAPDKPQTDDCVHLEGFPALADVSRSSSWELVMATRERVLKRLEESRSDGGSSNPLDSGVTLQLSADHCKELQPFVEDLTDLCGVSRLALVESDGTDDIEIQDLSEEPRCERSWKRDGTVKERSDGGMLSDRDALAVGVS